MKITCVAKSRGWKAAKLARLTKLVRRLRQLRAEIWVNKAKVIVCEDLASTIKSSKKIGKNQKRRLLGWVKGLLANALEQVSLLRGASVVPVNVAYTSQICSCCGCLGRRNGDKFYCINNKCGVVLQADWNTAINIKLRKNGPEIGQWTAYTEVQSILLERSHQRLGFLNQDSRCHEEIFLRREYLRPLTEQNA